VNYQAWYNQLVAGGYQGSYDDFIALIQAGDVVTYEAGMVTAYGAAVEGGYTGAYADFCAQQAQYAENAAYVAETMQALEHKLDAVTPGTEALLEQIEQAAASAPAELTAVTSSIASLYNGTATYKAGDYCFYNDSLYRCKTAIDTPEPDFVAAHWEKAKMADDMQESVADLKSANGVQDKRSNQLLGLMNYGYDTPADLAAGTSASTIVSVKRVGTEILLNGSPTSYQFVAKINNDVQRAATTSQVNALTNGTVFTSGHTYRITLKYISGSGTYNSATYIPWVSVYKSGTSSTVGTQITSTETEYCREFTADGSTYMICVYCHKGSNLSNMFVSVTMRDMADQSIYEMIDSLTVAEGTAWE
jgi:hypothetical protein